MKLQPFYRALACIAILALIVLLASFNNPAAGAEPTSGEPTTVRSAPDDVAADEEPEPSPSAAPIQTTEPTPTPSVALTPREQISQQLKNALGINDAAIAGIMANMDAESKLNPEQTGDHGNSLGLCQWHAGRMRTMIAFCDERGFDAYSIDGQIAFLAHELNSDYYAYILERLQAVPDSIDGACDAGAYFCREFERPAGNVAAARGQAASDLYSSLN